MRFFNAALMLASQRINAGAATCDPTKQDIVFASTSGRF
jgi:hypothetical protein